MVDWFRHDPFCVTRCAVVGKGDVAFTVFHTADVVPASSLVQPASLAIIHGRVAGL
jgi:hypothetical protein